MAHRSHKAKLSRKQLKKDFSQLSSIWLLLLCLTSSFVAYYWSLILSLAFPSFVEAVNTHGFPPKAFALSIVFAALGAGIWLYGAIAYRCNELLFERYFR